MIEGGNVWCPWEVGLSKARRAGSNPVTSDQPVKVFFCKFEYPLPHLSNIIENGPLLTSSDDSNASLDW